MAKRLAGLLAMAAVASFISPSLAKCTIVTSPEGVAYGLCNTLTLGSSLHWNYHQSNRTLDLAFRAFLSSRPGWIAWGINPSAARMIGTQALVAVVSADGDVTAYPSPIASYSPPMKSENLCFNVTSISATYSSGVVTIFAVISLPGNSTVLSHVWQSSAILSGGVPSGHLTAGNSVLSLGTLDLLSGESPAAPSYLYRRNVHIILCVIGWGLLMPFELLSSMHLVIASPNLALIIVKSSPYVIGVAGWALGLLLGRDSVGVIQEAHLIIGTIVFCLGVLKVSTYNMDVNAIKVNVALLSFSLVVLSTINILDGVDIIGEQRKWKTNYIVFILTTPFLYALMVLLYLACYPMVTEPVL